MSLNIELDVTTLTQRLEEVEEGQAHIIALLERLTGESSNKVTPRTSPTGAVRKRHFVIKQPSSSAANSGRPTYQDIEQLVIIPYLKEVNTFIITKTAKELVEISDFFLKYYVLKRMEQGLYNNTKTWLDIPQEIKEDAVKRFDAFVRENLLFPFDKCENSWAGDFLLGVSWARHIQAAAAAQAARQQQQGQRQLQPQPSTPQNGETQS